MIVGLAIGAFSASLPLIFWNAVSIESDDVTVPAPLVNPVSTLAITGEFATSSNLPPCR